MMECFGIRIPLGSGNTPVWGGQTRRFDPYTGSDVSAMFLPTHGIPTTLAQQRPREASPTGKSRMGIATYSIPYQYIESARTRTVIMTDPDPIYAGEGRLITRGVIDPYASQIGSKRQAIGLKYLS